MKSIKDICPKDKRVLLRVDFNVPLGPSGEITDDSRIRAAIPTIKYLLDRGAGVILASHLGRPKAKFEPKFSLAPVAKRLAELIGVVVELVPLPPSEETTAALSKLSSSFCLMLENVRFHPGEEKNDTEFARHLAALADIFVNDAFGAAHRAHSSTVAIASFLPSLAGLLMEQEVRVLSTLLKGPDRPFVAVIGGAKVKDKVPVLESLVTKVDALLIAGGMANTFLAAAGRKMGASKIEHDMFDEAKRIVGLARQSNVSLLLPSDLVVADAFSQEANTKVVREDVPEGWMALDIGPDTCTEYARMIQKAKTIFWNGPAGVFEIDKFSEGTSSIARAIAQADALSVVGGGDSLAAVEKAGVADRITHLSTGGGASLEFLEGKKLPGITALEG